MRLIWPRQNKRYIKCPKILLFKWKYSNQIRKIFSGPLFFKKPTKMQIKLTWYNYTITLEIWELQCLILKYKTWNLNTYIYVTFMLIWNKQTYFKKRENNYSWELNKPELYIIFLKFNSLFWFYYYNNN